MSGVNPAGGNTTAWDQTRIERKGNFGDVDDAIASDLKGLLTQDKGSNDYQVYTTKKGDTFWDIAEAVKTVNKDEYGKMDTAKLAAQIQKDSGVKDAKKLQTSFKLNLDKYLQDKKKTDDKAPTVDQVGQDGTPGFTPTADPNASDMDKQMLQDASNAAQTFMNLADGADGSTKDGKISKAELRDNDTVFNAVDADKNGELDKTELASLYMFKISNMDAFNTYIDDAKTNASDANKKKLDTAKTEIGKQNAFTLDSSKPLQDQSRIDSSENTAAMALLGNVDLQYFNNQYLGYLGKTPSDYPTATQGK